MLLKKTEMKVEAMASAASASLVVTPPYRSVAFYSFDRIVAKAHHFTMALMISRTFHLPLDVSHILESFVHRAYHAAFILKYGRGIVCRRARRWDLGGSTFPPMPPGLEIFAWEIDFSSVKGWDGDRLLPSHIHRMRLDGCNRRRLHVHQRWR